MANEEGKTLAKSLAFFQQANQNVVPAVERIMNCAEHKSFRVCVVGGFSRGKSHFINQLLDADILPEAAVPATSCLVEIAYANEPSLEIIRFGKMEKAAPDKATLDSFSLYNNPAKDVTLRLYWPAEFLRGGIMLVDTPGVEEATGDSAEITYNALQDADAAIVMVSALAPLSMTEQAFIAEYMLDRQIPLVAAAISYYDQLAGDEVAQLEYLAKKCGRLYSSMPLILPGASPGQYPGYVCGLDAARRFIVDWSRNPKLETLKMRGAIARIMRLVEAEIASLRASRELLQGDAAEKREQMREAHAALDDGSELLTNLRIAFVTRAEALQDAARKDLKTFRQGIIARSGNPDIEDFAREALTNVYRDITTRIAGTLREDLARLAEILEQSYGSGPAQSVEISFGAMPRHEIALDENKTNPALEELLNKGFDLADRYAQRLPGGAMIWPMLRPLLGQVVENIRNIGSDAQRNLDKSLSSACSRISRSLGEDLRNIYGRAFEQARERRRQWLMEQKKTLAEAAGMEEIKARSAHLDDLLAQGMELYNYLQKKLGELK